MSAEAQTSTQPAMRLGVIGGGRRCLTLMRMIDIGELDHLAAVANPDPDAVGLALARQRGLSTTQDFHDLLQVPHLDQIIELAGQEELLRELADSGPLGARLAQPQVSRLLAGMVDLGQRLRCSEEECVLAGALAQTLSSASGEGVMVLGTDYRIKHLNPKALHMVGLSEEEALGRHCFQVSHHALGPCDSPEHPCPIKHILATGQSGHAIHRHTDANGRSQYYDVTTYPMINQQGLVLEVLEIICDITQDLDDQVELRTRNMKQDLSRLVQEDKLISLGKLVASVAHEINNPIGSIFNFTKLIHKSLSNHLPTAEEQALFTRWLKLTVGEAQRCGRIVSNLLTFARQQSLEPRCFNLCELLDTILTLVRHRMDLSDVELVLELEENQLPVWGDYAQLQQCITNLIFNALEAMPQGGRLGIRGGHTSTKGQISLTVWDTGPGIAPEHRPFIFEPFFSTRTQGQGVGLGLSMVYGIIKEHDSDILVDSQPGQGAAFTLLLPSAPPEAAAGLEAQS